MKRKDHLISVNKEDVTSAGEKRWINAAIMTTINPDAAQESEKKEKE